MPEIQPLSVLRCPACGHEDRLAMPTDACLFFHECASCGTLLRPKPGDCCVFCSYGSVRCPPAQADTNDASERCGCDATPVVAPGLSVDRDPV